MHQILNVFPFAQFSFVIVHALYSYYHFFPPLPHAIRTLSMQPDSHSTNEKCVSNNSINRLCNSGVLLGPCQPARVASVLSYGLLMGNLKHVLSAPQLLRLLPQCALDRAVQNRLNFLHFRRQVCAFILGKDLIPQTSDLLFSC